MSVESGVLERFMKEFFPFSELKNIGFFKEEMKDDYFSQAQRVCEYFGYDTVYEHGVKEIRCHLTFVGEIPEDEPFITTIESIYD